ncbi:hypothetical protein CR513_11253, partial [Mucuna pruriens]
MKNNVFETEAIAIPLAGYDLIREIQWLGKLGRIIWVCGKLEMEFWKDGKKITLVANPQLNKVITEGRLNKMTLHLKKMHDKGIVAVQCNQPNSSPFAFPVVLVKKKDGRMCVDYRLTVRSRFPIPLVEDLLDELSGAKVYSKLDLRSGYHQIRMKSEDMEKTAFQTHSGQYEFVVMPFGLTNAPSTFQGAIYSGSNCKNLSWLYSKNEGEHLQHLRIVLQILRNNCYYVKKRKCKGVSTYPSKVQAVVDWPQPQNVKQLQSFLALTGYYRQFIKGFSIIAAPLTDLFKWQEEAQVAFTKLKEAIIKAPVLRLPDTAKPFEVGLMHLTLALELYLAKNLTGLHSSLKSYLQKIGYF